MLACAGCPAWPQVAARIELLPQVQVQGDRVVLGEVARLQSDDLATMRQLVELPLGPAPRAGEAAVVRREMLMQWMRRRSDLDPARFHWNGANETRVVRASQRVEGERIANAAAAAMRVWLAERGGLADLQVRRPPGDLELPAGELRLEVRRPALGISRAHLQVWVDISVAGRLVRSVPVLLEAAGANQGGVVERAAGVTPAIAVSRGDWASLHTAAGAVSLESRVEVLQDGHVGDKVRVRTRGATGLVLARVVAPGQLELAP
jgi:flagella basal body P-ring formation protein FlgA